MSRSIVGKFSISFPCKMYQIQVQNKIEIQLAFHADRHTNNDYNSLKQLPRIW